MNFRSSLSGCLFGYLLLLPIVHAQAAQPHFPGNEDLRQFKRLHDPRLAPDGKQILVHIVDSTADGGKSHLWLLGIDGAAPRQLTYSPESDKQGEHDGEWMPDGRSALFLAKRGEQTSLYQLPMDGGEAKAFDLKITPVVDQSTGPEALPIKEKKAADAATRLAMNVSRYAISPDGKRIAIIADDPQTPGEKAQKDAKADAQWVNHNPHGARVYLLTVATGEVSPVAVAPDVRYAYWRNDSSRLLVIADGMNAASDLGPSMSSWLVDPAAANRAEKLADLSSSIETAAWSLDGNSIFYTAQAKQDTPPGYSDLYSYDTQARTTKDLSAGFGGSLRRALPVSCTDGSVVQLAESGFHGRLARFAASGGEPSLLETPLADVSAVVTNASRSGWVVLGSGGGKPPQLYFAADLQSPFRPVALPPLSPQNLTPVAGKPLHWQSDQFTIEGLLYLPPEAATRRVPLIVEVHGGPLGAFADAHEPWVDFLVGHGWAVLRTNPRGSSGYGATFAAANKNDLGGGDYRDIMAGVDFVLRTQPIDAARMALMGYSYGGEMAAFAEGKTDRFKAIISGAPVIDQHSEYGTEEGSWYDRWYFGKPWEHPEDAWRQSPLATAGKAKTPFLLLQGESDVTDPPGQSKEMYRALRQMGVPVELVVYPRDDHGPLAMAIFGMPTGEPWHGFDARRRIVEFLQKAFDEPSK